MINFVCIRSKTKPSGEAEGKMHDHLIERGERSKRKMEGGIHMMLFVRTE